MLGPSVRKEKQKAILFSKGSTLYASYSDQCQMSLCNINSFSVGEVMRIKDLITKPEFR